MFVSRTLFIFLFLFTAGTAVAHHSMNHFVQEFTEMEGTLVDLRWRNPHVFFILETENEQGEKKRWEMEAGTIYMIGRAGITEDMFNVGDRLRVAGNMSNLYDDKFWLTNVLLPEGKEVLVVARGAPRWTDEIVGGRSQWTNNGFLKGDIDAERSGIFRVWSPAVGETPRLTGPRANRLNQVATEEALSGQDSWDPYAFDDACEVPGMPRINTAVHPHQFIEDGENIILIGEEFYTPRTIHMNTDADPEEQPYSALGYSVGRWQDENTLLIETSRIDYDHLDLSGILQSDQARVSERYVLSDDEGRIDYEVITEDPVMLTQPYIRRGVWLDLEESIDEFDCVPKVVVK